MSLDTQLPNRRRGYFRSPDLQLGDSVIIWGPLQISIYNHCQSAHLGYQAGETAYQDLIYRVSRGLIKLDTLEQTMNSSLAALRYRPRVLTEKIVCEWRAMFLLGWTNQMIEDLGQRREVRA